MAEPQEQPKPDQTDQYEPPVAEDVGEPDDPVATAAGKFTTF